MLYTLSLHNINPCYLNLNIYSVCVCISKQLKGQRSGHNEND